MTKPLILTIFGTFVWSNTNLIQYGYSFVDTVEMNSNMNIKLVFDEKTVPKMVKMTDLVKMTNMVSHHYNTTKRSVVYKIKFVSYYKT